jgi:pSer/pThr/pTyr-binding forkhead associated (FHA) protein
MALFFLTGPSHPSGFELTPGFNTIGRNPTNDLRLHDATVSNCHCEIVVTENSVLVRDLGSANGTFVEGRRVEESPIDPAQILRLGNVELRLERREDAETATISIPKLTAESSVEPVVLADGYAACLNHSAIHATFRCRRCQKNFCQDCVHLLRLTGGQTRVLCPACSGQCESLPVPPGAATTPTKRKESILGRLTQTIRIRLK